MPPTGTLAGVQAMGVADNLASLMTTPLSGTLPPLVATNEYAIVSPASVMPLPLTSIGAAAVFTRLSAGAAGVTSVDVVDGGLVVGVPPGGVPVAVALLSTEPAVSSAAVIV